MFGRGETVVEDVSGGPVSMSLKDHLVSCRVIPKVVYIHRI